MPGLGPGIGEEKKKAAQAGFRQSFDNVPAVSLVKPDIGQRPWSILASNLAVPIS